MEKYVYVSEKEMKSEFYNKHKAIFTKGKENKIIKRIYNIIVNPITYGIVNSMCVGMIIKKGNQRKHILSKVPMIMFVSMFNMNVFLFKSQYMEEKKYNNNKQLNYKVSQALRIMVNPVFTLQKDLALLRLIQMFSVNNIFYNKNRIGNKPHKQIKYKDNKIEIKEGFL